MVLWDHLMDHKEHIAFLQSGLELDPRFYPNPKNSNFYPDPRVKQSIHVCRGCKQDGPNPTAPCFPPTALPAALAEKGWQQQLLLLVFQ